MSALPPLMSLIGVHALLVVNAVTRSLKSTARSRAQRIGFDPAADSIRIRSIKIGFDPNSVLESVRTLVGIIRWKPVLTHASIVCEGMLVSVNLVNRIQSDDGAD